MKEFNNQNGQTNQTGEYDFAEQNPCYETQNQSSVSDNSENPTTITPENKTLCVFSWIPALSWIFYLCRNKDKDNRDLVACANQSLIILLGLVATTIIDKIVYALPYFTGWHVLNMVVSGACNIVNIILGIFAVIGLIKACSSEVWCAPLISKVAKKLNILK